MKKEAVLIKLSGEALKNGPVEASQPAGAVICDAFVRGLVAQLKILTQSHVVGIVVGGGNFFRGGQEGKRLQLQSVTADSVGMLATVMNGLILRDYVQASGIACSLMSAYPIAGVVDAVGHEEIVNARNEGKVMIFVGGTGNPFFTTDTAAIVRALQIGACVVWKATDVDFVYDADPAINPEAKPLKTVTYDQALEKKLKVMDLSAFALAREHGLTIRVFNVFASDALLNVAKNKDFGSTVL